MGRYAALSMAGTLAWTIMRATGAASASLMVSALGPPAVLSEQADQGAQRLPAGPSFAILRPRRRSLARMGGPATADIQVSGVGLTRRTTASRFGAVEPLAARSAIAA